MNEFWTDPNYCGTAVSKIEETSTDDVDTTWGDGSYKIERSWHDGEIDEQHKLTYELVVSPSSKRCLKVTIPAGFENQNVGVNLTDNSDNIIWSWHLWITDYNPYVTSDGKTPLWKLAVGQVANTAVQVSGGDGSIDSPYGYVHRYSDVGSYDAWVSPFIDAGVWSGAGTQSFYKGYSGYYEDVFIMDRNVGAIEATYAGQGNSSGDGVVDHNYDRGMLCYQFGRKDPFPGRKTLNYYDEDDNQFEVVNSQVSVVGSVRNPKNFYFDENYDWNSDNSSNTESVDWLWNDYQMERDINALEYNIYCVPYIRADVYGVYDNYLANTNSDLTKSKSIYDPSPLGWCMPVDATWNNFTDGSTTTWTDKGVVYNAGSVSAYYPAEGYIYGGVYGTEVSGKFGRGETGGYYWSSSPDVGDSSSARYMQFEDGSFNRVLSMNRSNGYTVRAVLERPVGLSAQTETE